MGRRGRPGMGFGSGPMLRGGRRPGEQRIGPQARARLMEAHQLKRDGRWAEAAVKFTEMAAIARERQMARMASTLAAQAAQCHAKAGDRDGFVRSTESAIGDARLEADTSHSSRTFGELLGSLDGTPFASGAPQIESALRDALGVAPAMGTSQPTGDTNRNLRRHVPAECDACGGPVSAADVKYGEDGHADCAFCGSILTA